MLFRDWEFSRSKLRAYNEQTQGLWRVKSNFTRSLFNKSSNNVEIVNNHYQLRYTATVLQLDI